MVDGITPLLAQAGANPGVPGLAAGQKPDERQRILDAAERFEAVLIGQLLKSARESGSGGWLGGSENQADMNMLETAEGYFAEVLARQGGLGLARLVAQQLTRDHGNDTQPKEIPKE